MRDVAIGRSDDQMGDDFAFGVRELLDLPFVDQRKGSDEQGLAADGDFCELRS